MWGVVVPSDNANDRRYLINVEHRIVESPIDIGHLTAGNNMNIVSVREGGRGGGCLHAARQHIVSAAECLTDINYTG